jgi:hypothetical protein
MGVKKDLENATKAIKELKKSENTLVAGSADDLEDAIQRARNAYLEKKKKSQAALAKLNTAIDKIKDIVEGAQEGQRGKLLSYIKESINAANVIEPKNKTGGETELGRRPQSHQDFYRQHQSHDG